MAEVTPPLFQTIDAEYDGSHLGLPYRDIIAEGVVGSSALAVTQRGAGANMSVDVAAGAAWIEGDDSAASQPMYRVYNDATKNLTVTAADATNPRIDLVIAEVRDAAFSGVSTDWRLRVVAGTPAGSPSAPATPSNSIVLARLSVPALDTTISTAQITDYRPRAGLFSSLAVPTVTSLPTQPYDGQVVDYVADSTNGVIWRLKYRAASGSSYKWEFVGGSAMRHAVETLQTTGSATFTDLGTVGPTLTVPLAGDYDITWTVAQRNDTSAGFSLSVPKLGSASADGNDAAETQAGSSATAITTGHTLRKTLAASDVVKVQYRVTGGTGSFHRRQMRITPVRVG